MSHGPAVPPGSAPAPVGITVSSGAARFRHYRQLAEEAAVPPDEPTLADNGCLRWTIAPSTCCWRRDGKPVGRRVCWRWGISARWKGATVG